MIVDSNCAVSDEYCHIFVKLNCKEEKYCIFRYSLAIVYAMVSCELVVNVLRLWTLK